MIVWAPVCHRNEARNMSIGFRMCLSQVVHSDPLFERAQQQVKLEDKLILGVGPAGTGPSRKIVDLYLVPVLAPVHLQRRTQPLNKWLHRC